MATFRIRKQKDGSLSYGVEIRKKNLKITKSFATEEDAKLYAFHKERLIDLIDNFEVPKEKRISLAALFEMKVDSLREDKPKGAQDVANAALKILSYFEDKLFYDQINYQDWMECAKKLAQEDVYKGVVREWTKRQMSIYTLRNIFAYASSSVSHAQSLGFNLENYPLMVLKTYIMPKLNAEKKLSEKLN